MISSARPATSTQWPLLMLSGVLCRERPILTTGQVVAPCLQRLSSPGRGPRVRHRRRVIASMSRATGSTALIRSRTSFSALSQDRHRRDFGTVVSFWPAPQRASSRLVPVRPDPARARIGPNLVLGPPRFRGAVPPSQILPAAWQITVPGGSRQLLACTAGKGHDLLACDRS